MWCYDEGIRQLSFDINREGNMTQIKKMDNFEAALVDTAEKFLAADAQAKHFAKIASAYKAEMQEMIGVGAVQAGQFAIEVKELEVNYPAQPAKTVKQKRFSCKFVGGDSVGGW